MTFALLPFLRLVRSKATWSSFVGWSLLVLAGAWMQHRHGLPHGADRALDMYASVVVPLLVYGLVAIALGKMGLAKSGRALIRLGAPPARVALATVVVTMLVSAVLCGALGSGTVALAHGSGDPPLAHDALQTLAFGALAGAAYAAYFMVGGAVLASFWGRALLLLLDWALGSDEGFGALLTPRAHLRNLLGGEPPFDALPWESLAGLAAIAIVCMAWSVRRAAGARV